MLIEEFMPDYHMREHHKTTVRAPARQVYDTLPNVNMFDSRIVRGLFWLRGLPERISHPNALFEAPELTLNTMLESGFVMLGEDPPHELLIGIVMPFGAPPESIPRSLDAAGFSEFEAAGIAKAVMNFSLSEPAEGVTLLETETRTFCLDEGSRRRFRLYWLVIGPFSALIRRLMLRAIKREVERPSQEQQ